MFTLKLDYTTTKQQQLLHTVLVLLLLIGRSHRTQYQCVCLDSRNSAML